MSIEKLQKTSVQLSAEVVRDLKSQPGLTMSEAIRLAVERNLYISTLDSEEIAGLADEYAPILGLALDGLQYDDYRLAARALPSIVEGFVRENPSLEFRYEGGDAHALDLAKLVDRLRQLGPLGRIGVMDCTIARRHRARRGDAFETVMPRRGRRPRRSSNAA